MESTLDEVEDALEREKKARLEQERNKRKAEAEVKSMQHALDALERSKKGCIIVLFMNTLQEPRQHGFDGLGRTHQF